MFRFMRPRQTILSISRLPLSVEAQANRGQVVNVQKVRFKKPGIRIRNVAISCLTFCVCSSVYSSFVLDPLESAAQELVATTPEDELEEEDEKLLFIPLPGTTKQLPPIPYKGSDPEWQEFIKFSKDPKLSSRVRSELAAHVKFVAERQPFLAMRCGKEMKIGKVWLDIDFPQHPPPEFIRSGIVIADDYTAIAEAPVDSLTVFRIRQALWPSALGKSLWSFAKVMVRDDLRSVAEYLGLQQSRQPPNLERLIARHQQLIRPPPTKDGPPQVQPVGDSTKVIANATTSNPALIGRAPGMPADYTGTERPSRFFRALVAFGTKYSQTWTPAPNYPPRGSILVSGLVELDCPKAYLIFDVRAAWDPKTREFDARTLYLRLRRSQLKRQGPSHV